MPEPGWLKRQYQHIMRESKTWPSWMRRQKPFSIESLSERFPPAFPANIVKLYKGTISVVYDKTGFPQVNIKLEKDDRVCWRGYWSRKAWDYPIGKILGLPECKYVLPGGRCEVLPILYFDKNDPKLFEKLQDLTSDLFERSNYNALKYPPIPEGYRMATPEEIDLSK